MNRLLEMARGVFDGLSRGKKVLLGVLVVASLLVFLGLRDGPQSRWKNQLDWQTFSGAKEDKGDVHAAGISVSGPEQTSYDDNGEGTPHPVTLHFSASAAPLALVGKEAVDVTVSPPLPGKWTWAEANRLVFQPDQDWPVGEKFTVTLGAKTLAPHVSVNRELTFRTPKFTIDLRDAIFYQDPVQVTLRKAVFEVGFSHPVDPDSFEKRLSLSVDDVASGLLVEGTITPKFTVTYNKNRLMASVHSEPLAIPQTSAAVTLRIDPGVGAQRGGNPTESDLTKSVAIPGLASLDITELNQLIVTADNGEPESVLRIKAGMAVHEKEMARAISAWLLPVNPSEGGSGQHVWSDPETVTDEILGRSQKVTLTALPTEREISETHAFKFAAEPGRFLLVRIDQGLKSAGGYELGATRNEILRVKRFSPELAIMSKGSLLALSGDRKLPVIIRDLPGVHLEIGRLLPQQLQHLVTQSDGDMTKLEFYSGITPDHLTDRFERNIPLRLKPGKTHYETIDFTEYLRSDASDRRGVFLLTVQGFDPSLGKAAGSEYSASRRPRHQHDEDEWSEEGSEEEGSEEVIEPQEQTDPSQMRDRRLVIVTDLGIVAKQSLDGGRDVFVQSVASGQPVAGATVEIWAKNGSALVAQTTEANGHARLPSVAGLTREKTPVVLVVRKAGDLSFMPLNQGGRTLDTSRFDVGGLHPTSLPNQIQAYLFSDRGIYRPGDTMNIGIVAKSTNWAQKLVDMPVEVEVIDARGLVVRRDKLKLGAGGMAEFSHTTQDVSPTGNYVINLNLARDSGSAAPGTPETRPLHLGSVTVKVQEFMPDRMKVAAKLSNETDEGWVRPQDLKALINVQNLFGTPAPNRRVEGSITLSPAFPNFRSHEDYQFFDPEHAKEHFRSPLEQASTDDNGNAEFALDLQRYAQATYQLHVLFNAFEPEGGRSVSAEAGALVSDRPYLVGHKTDGDLSYIARNGMRRVEFIAIDPRAKKTDVSDLHLLRIQRHVVSVLVKQPNGLFKYESRARESVLKEDAFAISAKGASVTLATQTPGNFAYVVRDAKGLELSRVEYSVAGNGNVSRSLDRNAELQMTLNQKDYEPGEEIEVSIRAPYVGAGLITIERDKVYAYKWFRTSDTASVQRITLPKDFEGNGYVSVQFIRDIASNEIYMSPLSYGIQPFATSLARRTNKLVLHAPELLKPGQTAKFRLESKTPGRALVFAVDEGILQVARYQSPDPLKFFFQKRALEVRTSQTLDLILPEFKKLMQAAPGGDAEAALGKHLNPFKRRTDKPVVYWSGIVDIDGSREFSYTVPENFNGALRVMAVTVNDDLIAAETAKTTVRGDLVLLPNVPVAMTPGDEVEIGVGVANNAKGSGKDAKLNLTLSVSPALEVVGAPTQTLKVSERSEVSTRFRVRAKVGGHAEFGSASVIFNAQVGEATARLSTDLSVRPASAFVTLIQSGMFRGSAVLASQGDFFPNHKRSELALSTSPWAFTAGLIQYLDVYPHGCSEQITSQTMPMVILSTQPGVAEQLRIKKQSGATVPDPKKSFDRYLALVRARQTADGGFAMWPGRQSDLFATTYIVNLLVEARDRKFAVPNDMLQRANVFLQLKLADASATDGNWRTQAQAAYLLARQGVVMTAALSNLHEGLRKRLARNGREALRRDIGTVYLAASFQMQKQEALAEELLQPALNELNANADPWRKWYWDYYYDPLVHHTTVAYLLVKHFPKLIMQLPMDYWTRIAEAIGDNNFQSLSAARMLLTVDAYAAYAAQSSAGKVSIDAIRAAGAVKALELPSQLTLAKLAVPADAASLNLNNGGDLPLFYSWSETGYENKLPKEAVSRGLEIIHEFLDASDQVVTEANLGDELTVRVRVRATERDHVSQVALVDVLPGGLEPVLSSTGDGEADDQPIWQRRLGGKSSWAIDYADIREDRVIFYGDVSRTLTEVTYKVRATNVGDFVIPAAYGEGMYERRIAGRSLGGMFKVKPVAQ